jgi:hypothetical protein
MMCAKYIFVSSILDGVSGLQWEQAGDRRITVPGYLGSLFLAWTTKGLKIRMDKAVCRVRVSGETIICASELTLPWKTGETILLLHDEEDTVFAQICISKTDDSVVWNEYKGTITNEEFRLLSDINDQECYFWRALSSDDFYVAYELLQKTIAQIDDMMKRQTCCYDAAAVLDRLKHLQYKYSVKLLNSQGQSEEALDRTACVIRSLMVDECYKL